MIGYDQFTDHAPPRSTKEERDAWFTEHGYDPEDLIRVGRELAEWRIADLVEGDQLSEQELVLALTLAVCFGFELAVRCERGEKPVVSDPKSNGAVVE